MTIKDVYKALGEGKIIKETCKETGLIYIYSIIDDVLKSEKGCPTEIGSFSDYIFKIYEEPRKTKKVMMYRGVEQGIDGYPNYVGKWSEDAITVETLCIGPIEEREFETWDKE